MYNTTNYHQLKISRPEYTKNSPIQKKYIPSYYYDNTQQETKTFTRGMSEAILPRNNNRLINEPLTKPSYVQSLKDQILSPGDNIEEYNSKALYSPTLNVNPYYYNTRSINSYDKPISSSIKDTPCAYLPQCTKNNKKTLVLDLDETLVHSAFNPFFFKADLILNINVDNADHNVYVLKRPYCDEFLEKMANHYELVVFTASISQYANPLLDQLDKKHLISNRLFREHCVYSNGLYVKDLKRLGRNLKDTLIVDVI